VPTAGLFESNVRGSPFYHSAQDTPDSLSFAKLAKFTRIVLGFGVELGGWNLLSNNEMGISKEGFTE
jgi:hypothetical protein